MPGLALAKAGNDLPAATLTQALALVQRSAKAGAPAGARIVVQPGSLDARLQLAPCAQITPYLPAGVPVWGRTRVGLRCSQGAAWNVTLPVQVQVWAAAVVSTQALPAGASLGTGQLELAEIDWAAQNTPPFAQVEALHQRVLVRPVQPGQALRLVDLQARQWFKLGETVQVHATGPGFSIATEGQALSPGVEGQTARVRTDSGRIVSGTPVGERRLEVRL